MSNTKSWCGTITLYSTIIWKDTSGWHCNKYKNGELVESI